MRYFWSLRETIPEGKGYGQFSSKHLLWLTLSVLFVAAIIISYVNLGPQGRLLLKRAIAMTLALIEIIKMIVIFRSGVPLIEYLPIEICSLAGYSIMFDAAFPANGFFKEILIVLFLPAAIMAIIFPTSTVLPAFSFFTIHQFLFHDLIIAYILARFISGEIVPTYPGVWRSILQILVVIFFIYLIDSIFDKNYMFLKDDYGNAMLGQISKVAGSGWRYTLGLILFAIFVINIFFVFFKIIYLLFIG